MRESRFSLMEESGEKHRGRFPGLWVPGSETSASASVAAVNPEVLGCGCDGSTDGAGGVEVPAEGPDELLGGAGGAPSDSVGSCRIITDRGER